MKYLEFEAAHSYPEGFQWRTRFATDQLVTALCGPSGSGKTTILEMIAGFRRPQEGCILDRTMLDTAAGICFPPERRRVGFIFQERHLFPHLSVQKNLLYGWKKEERHTISFDRIVEILELGGFLQRYPRGLSGGEKQRVALGRVLLSQPEILLLDEPLTALEEALKNRLVAYIASVIEEWHIPSVIVSHSRHDVKRLSGWMIGLEEGTVRFQGPTPGRIAGNEAAKAQRR